MSNTEDPGCKCHEIEARINREYPSAGWRYDDACCEAWEDRKAELVDNDIEFEPHSDECSSCTCPTCGRVVCSWCV